MKDRSCPTLMIRKTKTKKTKTHLYGTLAEDEGAGDPAKHALRLAHTVVHCVYQHYCCDRRHARRNAVDKAKKGPMGVRRTFE